MAYPQAVLLMIGSLWCVASGISVVVLVYAVLSDTVCSSKSDLVSDQSCKGTMKTAMMYDVSRVIFVSANLVAVVCVFLVMMYSVTTT